MAQTYEVRGPNGETFEVEAPDGATEQDVLAQVQKASRLAPADEEAYASLAANPSTTKADLKGFASQHGITLRDGDIDAFLAARNKGSRVSKRVVYENLPRAPKASLAQNIGAMVGTAVDGVLPGVARTNRGIHGAISNAAKSLVGSEEFDPAAAFQQGKDEQDYAQARFGVEHPDASTVATAAGLVGGLALPEARVVRGAGLLPGMANAALTSGGYGALSGILNETGGGNLENMALGAGVGSVLGAGGTAAFRGAANAAGAARRTIPGVDATARFLENVPRRFRGQPQAQPGDAARAQGERILANELGQGTIATGMGAGTVPSSPANIAAEVNRRAAMGVPAVPADVSEPGRRITSWALQGNGPSTSRARQMLLGRQAGQGARVRGHITDELGPAVDPIRAVDDINRRASEEAAPLYEEAYALPMRITPEIEAIARTPAFRDAVPTAIRNIRNAGRDPRAMGFRDRRIPGEEPEFDLPAEQVRTLSTEGFDQVIRAMRDNGQAAMDTSGFRPRNTTNSVHINARAGDLRRALADQNDPYARVTRQYADAMDVRGALENGQDVAKLTGPEITAQMGDMRAPNAREAWATGARTALADDATQAGLKPTANVAQRIRQAIGLSGAGRQAAGGDVAKQQAIEAMAQRPGALGRLDDRLEGEDQAFKTAQEVFGNSKTAPREALDEALSGHGLSVAAKAATGNLAGAISSLLFQGNPRGAFAFKRDVQERIAELMTAQGATNVGEAMQAIMRRAQTDAEFAEMLNRAGVKPSKLAAAYAASIDADAEPEDPVIQGPAYRR
ncbi:hypothetical protein [Sphingomonas sp. BK580]|uniref:hypothetical protein n=1 Tax=Sphingomonas sp. BK580 TaxID=2586972 RepID=UPI001615DD67|nr:hypothetical protein [Sphingomonas sp. BK580]MBB3693010.1 hypothetical protein [Sphingomonas sp. BK580]